MMATVVVDRRGTILQYQSGAMLVREPERPLRTVPLHLIDRLVIAGSVQVDASLLTQLAERQASVLVMPARGYRRASHLCALSSGDAVRRLGQYRLVLEEGTALQLARRLVLRRVLGQVQLLRRLVRKQPQHRNGITSALASLARVLDQARAEGSLERLRGLEGAAANRFFSAYVLAFPPAVGFTGRNRRPPRDPVNAVLSLGYTLLHGDAVQASAKAGLDPLLGFLHRPSHGRESLASDLVELARARVEHFAWRLFAEKTLRAEHFTRDNGACRLGKAGRSTFYALYERNASMHRRWFRRYAHQLAGMAVEKGLRTAEDPGLAV